MESHSRNRNRPLLLWTNSFERLERAQRLSIRVEDSNLVFRSAHGEDRSMLVNTKRHSCLLRSTYSMYGRIAKCIPKLDGAVLRTADQLPDTPTLHVKIKYGTVVFPPTTDSSFESMFALVVDTNCTILKAGTDQVALNLVGRDGGYSSTGECANFLAKIVKTSSCET